ncbi:MAG TPA: hypothetical protein VG847_13420 [Chitinophagaceae bacterium]|nr:hypothetical protein [Chitinophagaceae bacterium]
MTAVKYEIDGAHCFRQAEIVFLQGDCIFLLQVSDSMLYNNYKEPATNAALRSMQPCVSVIMPFNPKMVSKSHIQTALKHACDEVKRQLSLNNYPEDVSAEALLKLQNAIDNLDYTTHKESVAIYISHSVEKVYYLTIPVEEKVVVDTSFKIRNLVLNKKDKHEFLLLVISAKKEKIYVGSQENLTQIIFNRSDAFRRDLPEQVGNFTDIKAERETRLKNFLRYIDNGLELILRLYPLPLFIMTTKKTMGLFKQITKHEHFITGYVHGNFEKASEFDLRKALEPQIENWRAVKEKDVRNRLGAAQNDLKLVTGIHEVWKHASRKQGRLLVVEKDFNYPAHLNPQQESPPGDIVDDIIERVLESGGDVEFVDELKEYNHIALIEYYHTN